MTMIAIRLYVKDSEVLLAACDEELLGTTLRSDGMKLTVSRIFYHSETVDDDRLKELMRSATSMNLVGNRTVSIARELELVGKTLVVGGVEHAQVVRM